MKITKPLLISSFLAALMALPPVQAAQTIGDLLNRVSVKKTATALPATNLGFAHANENLETVKPPRSSELMQHETGDRAEYERVLNQQIQELYKLTQKFKSSPNRGELWLRLAELYVEKASLVDARKQDEYDSQLRAFQAGKTKRKPVLDVAEARDYNKKAIQLYEWFQRDFPKDEKMSQALFFLGYNYFELSEPIKGSAYYDKLTKQFPNSPFVGEAHFALGEYYFELEKWTQAYKEYSYIIKLKKHRLYTFALYKGGWCLFRLGRSKQAMSYLEYIIKSDRAENGDSLAGHRKVNVVRLEGEALRDIVVFYAESGDPSQAANYFHSLVGNNTAPYLEKLAYQYSDRGNKDASRDVFKLLIAQNPNAAKAFEYQYQIVQNYYYAKDTSRFKDELYGWVKNYDQNGSWYAANKGNKELIESSHKLRETTLRNYVLQQHQTAQNSHAPYSQKNANDGYLLYLHEFNDSPNAGDMHFYYGELLYDMGKYDEASVQYKWVVDNAPQSKFYGKSAQNLILAVERSIPTDQEMAKRVGNSLTPVPLDAKADHFVKAGLWYTEKFPNSEKAPEIKFRIGRLYYQSNQFDEAAKYFHEIVQKYPNTKYTEYSANLLLDIYNLKKDYTGLEKVAGELLAVPAIASSKSGQDIRDVMEKASFKKGQDLEGAKKYGESAQAYESFAKQNPKSTLASTAMFNAGINYERAGLNAKAIAAYQGVLAAHDNTAQGLKPKVRRLLAKQYQDSAQFEEAAKLYRQAADENPKDPLAPNFVFNAAVLYEALGHREQAVRNYNEFIRINKKKSENTEVLFSLGEIHRKAGQISAAVENYSDYVEKGGSDKEKVVEAAYWVTTLDAKVHAITKSKEWKQKTLAIQKRLAPEKKGIGATYAAKLKLEDAKETFKEMKSISFPANPARQKAAVNRKVGLLTQLTTELVDIIKYDSAEEIVSALDILGQANENMAQSILNAPLPPGLNAEETKQYKTGVDGFAQPFQAKAKDSFKAAVDRGWELEVYNSAYHNALDYMSKADPKNYHNDDVMAADTKMIEWTAQ